MLFSSKFCGNLFIHRVMSWKEGCQTKFFKMRVLVFINFCFCTSKTHYCFLTNLTTKSLTIFQFKACFRRHILVLKYYICKDQWSRGAWFVCSSVEVIVCLPHSYVVVELYLTAIIVCCSSPALLYPLFSVSTNKGTDYCCLHIK